VLDRTSPGHMFPVLPDPGLRSALAISIAATPP
jgi:hypothetical protein